MKPRSLLPTLFAGIFSLSLSAYAASDINTTSATKEPTSSVQPDQASNRKMHSHMQEKTGIPQEMPSAKFEKTKSTPGSDKHYHPRDGK